MATQAYFDCQRQQPAPVLYGRPFSSRKRRHRRTRRTWIPMSFLIGERHSARKLCRLPRIAALPLRAMAGRIRPVIPCGEQVAKLLRWIMADSIYEALPKDGWWKMDECIVIQGNHPSLRPVNAPNSLKRLIERTSAVRAHFPGQRRERNPRLGKRIETTSPLPVQIPGRRAHSRNLRRSVTADPSVHGEKRLRRHLRLQASSS